MYVPGKGDMRRGVVDRSQQLSTCLGEDDWHMETLSNKRLKSSKMGESFQLTRTQAGHPSV